MECPSRLLPTVTHDLSPVTSPLHRSVSGQNRRSYWSLPAHSSQVRVTGLSRMTTTGHPRNWPPVNHRSSSSHSPRCEEADTGGYYPINPSPLHRDPSTGDCPTDTQHETNSHQQTLNYSSLNTQSRPLSGADSLRNNYPRSLSTSLCYCKHGFEGHHRKLDLANLLPFLLLETSRYPVLERTCMGLMTCQTLQGSIRCNIM